jgi:sugar lactone lactonase YvrE
LEAFVRRSLGFALVATLMAAVPLVAQQPAPAQNVPIIPHTSVPNFFKLPPDIYFGEGIGIATNSKGHIFVYTRVGDTHLYEFDQNGAYVREIGQGLYGLEFAHAVRVDAQDNIWVVDEGTNMVIKFNPEGRVMMVIGRRPEAVAGAFDSTTPAKPAEKYRFGRPTDIGWDPQGNIFISDGYVNSRVVKYDKNGRFIKSVGAERQGSEPSQFSTVHGIAVDAQGNVYAADRGNRRVQVFDNDLVLRAIYDNIGAPWTICISPGPHQYLFVSNSNRDDNNVASIATSGEIYKMELDGTILGKFGKAGKGLGEFSTTHGIDCRNPNELYISEITAWRAQKIILNAPRAPTSAAAR